MCEIITMRQLFIFKNPYRSLGIVLIIVGTVLAPVFYFIVSSPPLAATGISAVILGMTCAAIANARPYTSPDVAQMLLKTGIENTAALLEEFGLSDKAIYVPLASSEGKSRALIPLSAAWKENSQAAIKDFTKVAGRLIIRYGPEAEDKAIAVTTTGSVSFDMLENKPGAAAIEIEAALNYLLVGIFDIAKGVLVVIADSKVTVRIDDPRIDFENSLYYQCVGSPIASIAATVIAEAINNPVRIRTEARKKKKIELVLEIL